MVDDFSTNPDARQAFHHKTWSALRLSAQHGCALCAQFLHGFISVTTWSRDSAIPTSSVVVPTPLDYELYIPFKEGDLDSLHDEKTQTGTKFTYSAVRMRPAPQLARYYDSRQPSTKDALELCKNWLDDCCESHNTCKQGVAEFLPTRLIDIGGKFSRLCLSKELRSCVKYATVSHCWGSLKFLNLTSKTLENFQEQIPSEALQKTFQDAIVIARYCGFLYLWIDSLCILQDSVDDWRKESSLMTEVYEASELNIAATAAENSSVGCFFSRETTWRCQVLSILGNQTDLDCYPRKALRSSRNRLRSRSWVVQERFLSRRTLHFAENQVFWECDENPACEILPNGYDFANPSIHCSFILQKHDTSWASIVNNYSVGELTKTSDKLIAISGLARMIHCRTGDDYIAGLWRECFEDELGWERVRDRPAERTMPYTAPTWSWASLRGGVRYYRLMSPMKVIPGHLCIEVINVQVQCASTDHFGEIISSVVRLRCNLLFSGIINYSPQKLSDIHFGHHTTRAHVTLDCLRSETSLIRAHILPIRQHGGFHRYDGFGLVLEPTGIMKGQYRRIGFYSSGETHKFATATGVANLLRQE